MLTSKQIKRLVANWGERADALDCNAEARIYDPMSKWECYIYALEPTEQDEIACIINGETVELTTWMLADLRTVFNSLGEGPQNDLGFIPIRITRLLKKLGAYDTTRN